MEQKIKYRVENQVIILWLLLVIICSTYAFMNYVTNKNFIVVIITISFPIICILTVYFVNKYRFNGFLAILRQLTSKSMTYIIKQDYILLKKNSYKMKLLKQSYDVVINPSFEKSKLYYCITDNFIILFIEITEFVFFKHYCKPIAFSKMINSLQNVKDVQLIEEYQKAFTDTGVIVTSKSFPNEIHSIKMSSEIINQYL